MFEFLYNTGINSHGINLSMKDYLNIGSIIDKLNKLIGICWYYIESLHYLIKKCIHFFPKASGVDIIFMRVGRKLDIKILILKQSCGCRVISTMYETSLIIYAELILHVKV